MSDSYQIISFDEETTKMVWKKLNGETVSMNLNDRKFTDYRGVHPTMHYLDTNNNQIVMVPTICPREKFVDNNILFIKASQFDFDRWSHEIYPKSDNAKVYDILMNI
jgi:hypothetical protein